MSNPIDYGKTPIDDSWKSTQFRFRLLIDNILEAANRKICRITNISIRKELFMTSLPDTKQTQREIKRLIVRKKPFAVIRFGLYEAMLCKQYLEKLNGLRKSYSEFIRYHIDVDAGMFTNNDTGLDSYAALVLSLLPEADGIAYWSNLPSKLIFSPFYNKFCKHIDVENLYPFPFWHNRTLPDWQCLLKGKRVVIVTAFADTVAKQYTKKDLIWPTADILPDFELIAYKAIQTSAGNRDNRFETWFDAFNCMVAELKRIDFDLALISCGSYGTPLALALKKEGKNAVQWGGCFQLWFGITGNRWKDDNRIASYINDSWCYPSIDEMPVNYKKVDGGSYWCP